MTRVVCQSLDFAAVPPVSSEVVVSSFRWLVTKTSNIPWLKRKKAQGQKKPQAVFVARAIESLTQMPTNALPNPGALAVAMGHQKFGVELGRERSSIGPLRKMKRALMRAQKSWVLCITVTTMPAARTAPPTLTLLV